MNAILVIPARFKSTRFPGKPLTLIHGRPMLQWVWDVCAMAEQMLNIKSVVATDDKRIADYCEQSQIPFVMTSDMCLTGTDRVYEVSRQIEADIYLNVQGDEPLIKVEDVCKVAREAFSQPTEIICGMCEISDEQEFRSVTVPKVVTRADSRLLYMSRSPIPISKSNSFVRGFKQVCIYAFPRNALFEFGKLNKKTPLEEVEDIELLRFLELGYDVRMIEVSNQSIAVDFPEDVLKVEKRLELGKMPVRA